MNISQTNCPECGEPVPAGEPCPHCGADVDVSTVPSLEIGSEYSFRGSGREVGIDADEVEITVMVEAQWAELVSRTVYMARANACVVVGEDVEEEALSVEDLTTGRFLVELLKEEQSCGLEELPGEGALPLRRPVAERSIDDHRVLLFRNDSGLSLAELVALADRDLSIRQVVELFDAVLDAISALHGAGILHLSLNPELIRVRPGDSTRGVPFRPDSGRAEKDDTSSLGEEDTNVETPEDEDLDDEWGRSEYDETRPQDPLGARMSELDQPELSSLATESSGLGEETSEVAQEGISAENWIREIGIRPAEQASNGDEEGVSDSRRDSSVEPTEGLSLELEALFDATAGLYSQDDVSEELPTTQGFSPPEMYGAAGPSLDTASDIFSAGMILYYLIAGRRPPASVYTRHSPAIPARNFRPEFPPGLGPVVKRSTRSDPEMRHPDVASMQSAFDDAVEAVEDRSAENRTSIPAVTASVDRHVGIAKRERNPVNQDNVFEGASEDGKFGLLIVGDGVSTASYGSGEIASELLIDVGEEVWNELLPAYLMDEQIDPIETVEYVLEEANERIVDWVNEGHTPFTGSAHEVMGTTALVGVYRKGTVTLGSIGDSRAYLQRGPGLEQLTIDHNLWTLSILEGLPADEALAMPRGDALARCLGTFELEDGELEPIEPGYDVFQFPVTEGDTLLMTTDGLVDFAGGNVVSAEENIQATLLAEPNPALACLELILLANRGGGGDNIGLAVAQFE